MKAGYAESAELCRRLLIFRKIRDRNDKVFFASPCLGCEYCHTKGEGACVQKVGYYKFDKTVDRTVDDVFKKADKAMYERKVAMKAERKD